MNENIYKYKNVSYETDGKTFPADAYKVKGYSGIAWEVLGWELKDTEETEWSGHQEKTGNIVAVMIGDDRPHIIEESDLIPILDNDYCGGCGQTTCYSDRKEA